MDNIISSWPWALPVIAVVFFFALPMLKKKAEETPTVLDDKILTYLSQRLKKYLPKFLVKK